MLKGLNARDKGRQDTEEISELGGTQSALVTTFPRTVRPRLKQSLWWRFRHISSQTLYLLDLQGLLELW